MTVGVMLMIRPQYAVFPGDEAGYTVDDQYYVGDSGLLFKPVVVEGAASTDVYLADDQVSSSPPREPRLTQSAILRLLLTQDVSSRQIASISLDRYTPVLLPAPSPRWSHYSYPSTSPSIITSNVARSIHIDHISQ